MPIVQLKVTAYATAEGYEQSETAEAIFNLANVGDIKKHANALKCRESGAAFGKLCCGFRKTMLRLLNT